MGFPIRQYTCYASKLILVCSTPAHRMSSWMVTPHQHIPTYISLHTRPHSPKSIENSPRYDCNTHVWSELYYMNLTHRMSVLDGHTARANDSLCKLPNEALLSPIHQKLRRILLKYIVNDLNHMIPNPAHRMSVLDGHTPRPNDRLCKLPNEAIPTLIHWDLRKILLIYCTVPMWCVSQTCTHRMSVLDGHPARRIPAYVSFQMRSYLP